MRHFPDDHIGESVLGAGKFTYVITVAAPKSEADFSVEATKD
jgi:hypothetical protein